MSTVFAPVSVKQMRFKKQPINQDQEKVTLTSLDYLINMINRVVVSEKYILDSAVLVLDVRPEAEKILMQKSLECISEGNPIRKITSSNRKPIRKLFKGKPGRVQAFKRMYIRFKESFNLELLKEGVN